LEIDLLVNSWGGDPGSSFAIYNYLRASGPKITAYNLGEVSSAATTIFLAGDKRFAAKHSFFKFHPTTWDLHATGNHGMQRVNDASASIEAYHRVQTNIYLERTKMKPPEISGLFSKTVIFTPDEALSRGIIEGIADPPA